MKKNSILVILFGVLLIVFGFVNPFNLGVEEKSKDSNDAKKDVQPVVQTKNFDGVYKKDNIVLKIYTLDNKIKYNILANDSYTAKGEADITDDTATATIFEKNYTFKLNGNNITLETNDAGFDSGEYVKEKNYTANDYFTDNYGDPKFVTSEITGLYEQENNKLYVYQMADNKISFKAELINNNTVVGEAELDANGNYTVTIPENTYSLKYENKNITLTSTDPTFSGTYTKKQPLTVEDIIKKF
ncbi:MAG: hypothetical protein IKQ35_06205 [Bacilli bacterium]|nr:hypothetical protein [Bacilli bacterium]